MSGTHSEFAYRLNRLFETKTKPDGSFYSEEELIAAAGGALSLRQLHRLRSGQSTNPSLRAVKVIADFFQVDVAYFTTSPEDSSSEIKDLTADDLTQEIAIRSAQLDDEGKQHILKLIDTILANSEQAAEDSGQGLDNKSKQGVSHDGK
jgi:hypothetical protein